ncbi:MAG: DUF975 family protein [Clostridia bacterium]|nr:DUF975 family protein [Clostridia bacterium]
MRIKELRARAREDASGSKMKLVLPTFLMTLLIYLIGVIPDLLGDGVGKIIVGVIAFVAVLFVSVSASYALMLRMLKVARKEETSPFFSDIFGEGMRNGWACAWGIFKKVWCWFLLGVIAYILMGYGLIAEGITNSQSIETIANPIHIVLILVGFVLFIVAMIRLITVSYRYFLVTYLKHDYPDRSIKELLEKSEEMMEGNKAKVFVIPLTFLGWLILSALLGAIVFVIFNVIWPPYTIWGITVSTVPLWAEILMSAIIYFIVSFVTAYMQLTYCEFYLERNPLGIYNEGYVKPETNPKKYKKIIAWVCAIFIILCIVVPIFLSALIFVQSSEVVHNASDSLENAVAQMANSNLRQYAGKVRGSTVNDLIKYTKTLNEQEVFPRPLVIKYNDSVMDDSADITPNGFYQVDFTDSDGDVYYDVIDIRNT